MDFMRQWWQTLDAHSVRPLLGSGVAQTVAGFEINLDPQDRHTALSIVKQCQALWDAIELVFVPSVVDRHAFSQRVARHLLDDDTIDSLPSDGDEFPCHMTIVKNSIRAKARVWMQAAVSTLLTPKQLHERDQAFQDARKQLLARTGSSTVSKKLSITISVYGTEWTRELASFVRTASPPAVDHPFRTIMLHLNDTMDTVQESLDDIVTCLDDPLQRVRLRSFAVIDTYETEDSAYGNVLVALLSAPHRERLSPSTTLHVTTPSNDRHVTQVCSAVMYAQGVKLLVVDFRDRFSRREHTQLIKWLAVCLFSHQAQHSIQEARLTRFFVDDGDMDDWSCFCSPKIHSVFCKETTAKLKSQHSLQVRSFSPRAQICFSARSVRAP